MPLPPTELRQLKLTGIRCTEQPGNNRLVELFITANERDYTAHLVNPVDLATQHLAAEANIHKRFEPPTTCVQFYLDRSKIEFWGEQKRISTIKCNDVKLMRM